MARVAGVRLVGPQFFDGYRGEGEKTLARSNLNVCYFWLVSVALLTVTMAQTDCKILRSGVHKTLSPGRCGD